MKRNWIGSWLIAVLATGAVAAGSGERWLHVRVVEDGDPTVNMNVPLEAALGLLPLAELQAAEHGRLRIGADDVDVVALLRELQASPDAEFLTLRDDDETVRVRKQAGFLLIDVDEGDGGETVRVRVPMAVVDALLSETRDGEVNLAAAVRALGDFTGDDLVTVDSGDSTVRVWIDASRGDGTGHSPDMP